MLFVIIFLLAVLWLFGYVSIGPLQNLVPHIVLFQINDHPVTLFDILILLLVGWAIGILPRPFREIAGVLLVLWVLSTVGIIAIAGLSSILVIAIIIGLVVSLLGF